MLAFMLSVFIVCIVSTAEIRNKSCLAGLVELAFFGGARGGTGPGQDGEEGGSVNACVRPRA